MNSIQSLIQNADAVLIGAGAGLSTSAGFTYSGPRFQKYFADFEKKYDFHDMYSGGFTDFETLAETWAYWSRQIFLNRYENAKISLIGIDCSGVRNGAEHTLKDQYCADRGVFIIENMWNLKAVVDQGGKCLMHTYPLNYAKWTGLPCRIIAEV